MELRSEALDAYVEECDRRSAGSVWTDGGCTADHLDATGRDFAIYPGFAAEFRHRTPRFDADAYVLEAA